MGKQNRTQLNRLLKSWPPNAIYTSSLLKSKGISRELVHYYQVAGWLEKIGNGAYKRASDTVEWTSGLAAIQNQSKLDIHLGGKSALQHQGFAHYMPLGEHYPLYLYGARAHKLPVWFKNYSWGVEVVYIQTKLFETCQDIGFTAVVENNVTVRSASPERAIMELLHLVPNRQSYDEALQLMGSLTTLRANVTQILLEKCNSIKVKRLFMVMAREYNYPWFNKIDTSTINFGKGKRELVKGGVLDPEYQITIPVNESRENIEV